MQKRPENEEYSEAETVRRMEAGLKRALTIPHKPLKKFKGKSAATGQPKTKARRAKKG